MKPKHALIFTLLISAMLVFVPNSFAQNASNENIVHMIYFLPNDKQPSADIQTRLVTLITEVQQFFADEMDRHGFGRKTFKLETDPTGKPIVHHILGKHTDGYSADKVAEEISKYFDVSKGFYLVFADASVEEIGFCARARSRGNRAGIAVFSAEGGQCNNSRVIAHELGHVFGLGHDFRADAYVMSYGVFLDPLESRETARVEPHRLSDSAAKWLDVHNAFNRRPRNEIDTPSQISLVSQRLISPPNTLSLRFQINDPEGLHQAQLMVHDGIEYVLVSHKSIDGSKNATVEFVTSDLIRSDADIDISVATIDVFGNFVECSAYFTLDETILRETYLRALADHEGWVKSIAFSPDGKKIATATSTPGQENGMLRLYHTDTGRHLQTLAPSAPYGEAVECIAFSPDGKRIAGGIGEGKVHLWNVKGKHLQALSLETWCTSIAFSPDGKRILAGGLGNAHLWDTSTGRLMQTLHTGVRTGTYVSFSPNGERIAALGEGLSSSVSIWNMNLRIRTVEDQDRVNDIAFSPNGQKIATVNVFAVPTVRLWNVNTGKHLQTLSHPVAIWSVSFSPDGKRIATGDNNGTIRLWHTNTGRHLRTLRGHRNSVQVQSLAFSPDGALLASGDNTGKVLLWEIPKAAAAPAVRVLSTSYRQTMLLPNYPNPFNPETWIPYQLSAPADVTITISAVDGTRVRTLALGHKPMGIYQNRTRAAYWDGKNEIGEQVSSGIYFYTLTAKDFSATRKMLIVK
ncbi:MAG: hypothetical protein OXU23_14005 [Candidatus Poribacteria bacterium]|nr:hypothetical protein [Candidatus Poribacteria bacterium]